MPFDLIPGSLHDVGALAVRRMLPSLSHQMVGPFIFFDHIGPAQLAVGQGMNVRPHPHIGLATVTYLFEGSGLHRDSLGNVQVIQPGDVNWMVAGRGIVHSERTPPADLKSERRLEGIQLWVALPVAHEHDAPSFSHHAQASLPVGQLPGVTLRLLLGSAWGMRSPVPSHSPMFYAAAQIEAGASLRVPTDYPERAVYCVDQPITIDGRAVPPQQMAVLAADEEAIVTSQHAANLVVLGGAPMEGKRHIHWNFVASSRELIIQARAGWQSYPNPQFPAVPDDAEWIPLPE